jgi:hypothetical protein
MPLIHTEDLTDKVTAAIEEKSGQIVLGMATDWADYKERTGHIAGLREVERFINEITEQKK